MTQEQFDNHAWRKSDRVHYKNQKYKLYAVDFADNEVEIFTGSFTWIQCKDIELVIDKRKREYKELLQLLFEIYEKGVKQENCNLTEYIKKINHSEIELVNKLEK